MNRYQKLAWFNLIVITAAIIITTTAIAMEIHWRGYSTIAPAFIVILVLMKLNPFLFKKPKGEDKVVSDERDSFIVKRARSFAYITFWIIFIVSSLAVYISMGMGPDSSVPTITLPLMAIGGAVFIKIVSSVAILVQYGGGAKEENHD